MSFIAKCISGLAVAAELLSYTFQSFLLYELDLRSLPIAPLGSEKLFSCQLSTKQNFSLRLIDIDYHQISRYSLNFAKDTPNNVSLFTTFWHFHLFRLPAHVLAWGHLNILYFGLLPITSYNTSHLDDVLATVLDLLIFWYINLWQIISRCSIGIDISSNCVIFWHFFAFRYQY